MAEPETAVSEVGRTDVRQAAEDGVRDDVLLGRLVAAVQGVQGGAAPAPQHTVIEETVTASAVTVSQGEGEVRTACSRFCRLPPKRPSLWGMSRKGVLLPPI